MRLISEASILANSKLRVAGVIDSASQGVIEVAWTGLAVQIYRTTECHDTCNQQGKCV